MSNKNKHVIEEPVISTPVVNQIQKVIDDFLGEDTKYDDSKGTREYSSDGTKAVRYDSDDNGIHLHLEKLDEQGHVIYPDTVVPICIPSNEPED